MDWNRGRQRSSAGSKVLLEKRINNQSAGQEITPSYGTPSFFTVFTRSRHWSLSCHMNPIHSLISYVSKIYFNIVFSSTSEPSKSFLLVRRTDQNVRTSHPFQQLPSHPWSVFWSNMSPERMISYKDHRATVSRSQLYHLKTVSAMKRVMNAWVPLLCSN
jgi:hypothetical protein